MKLLQHLILILSVAGGILPANSQKLSTPCTASMISTFTPCLNFVTGSSPGSGGGGSSTPTSGCCNSLKDMMSTSMDCACLILTANVPLPLSMINRTLSLGLPKACNMGGVPVQCKATGSPLPAPGPFSLAPPPSAASPLSPQASKATAKAPASEEDLPLSPDFPPEEPPSPSRIRPLAQPGQPSSAYSTASPLLAFVVIVAMLVFKCS